MKSSVFNRMKLAGGDDGIVETSTVDIGHRLENLSGHGRCRSYREKLADGRGVTGSQKAQEILTDSGEPKSRLPSRRLGRLDPQVLQVVIPLPRPSFLRHRPMHFASRPATPSSHSPFTKTAKMFIRAFRKITQSSRLNQDSIIRIESRGRHNSLCLYGLEIMHVSSSKMLRILPPTLPSITDFIHALDVVSDSQIPEKRSQRELV